MIEPLRRHLEFSFGRPVALVETHISWVLLDGEHAWKIKKPIRLGFLDFSQLQTRRRYCEEELRLNRRLAPSLYLDVVAVRGTPAEPRLDGDAPAFEYALRMKQFAAGSLFSERLAAGTLEPQHVDRFARRLADFHREAPSCGADEDWGSPERVRADTAGTLDRLAAMHRDAAWIATLRGRLDGEAVRLERRFAQRKADGWIREGHGDLHLANVVVLDDDVTAFDCIEFDPGLRWIDVQNDAAFLAMDLLAHERGDLGWRFVDAWLAENGDYEGAGLLRYYMAYRALVRALVAGIRAQQGGSRAAGAGQRTGGAGPEQRTAAAGPEQRTAAAGPDYAGLASRLLDSDDPRLIIAFGLSGSGKSYVSQRLLEHAGAIRLRSDVERKRLFGLHALEASHAGPGQGIYRADASQRTYDRLLALAGTTLDAGWPTIVDATFLRAGDRDRFRALARERAVPFAILHCHADPMLLRQRVLAREAAGGDASEAGLAVLERQFATHEALRDDERALAIDVDPQAPLDVAALAASWRRAQPPARKPR